MDKTREIARYGKLLHLNGLVIGPGGNISLRDGDSLIIKKKGADMSREDADDYIRVPFPEKDSRDGSLSSETPLHIACYEARKDIAAVIHVHSPYMIALAGRTDLLESTSYEFDCVLRKAVPVIGYIQPGTQELAAAVAEKIRDGANAVIMRRHGAISVGRDLEEAYLRILALDRACISLLLGTPHSGTPRKSED
ncbi:MAG: class II aldolase/adducin family protein [Candidatus Omnitrophota bacterium]|nr:class II aldolase/adducin family protein [Candidatus Omnitrophota bacterium]